MIYHGFRNTVRENGRRMIKGKEVHHRIGKITVITWLLSFASGIAIYYMLYVANY